MNRVTVIEQVGGLHIMTLAGEVDAFNAPDLREEVHELLAQDSVKQLLIDLSAVTFMDSAALGAIVAALRRLRERGGELRLVAPRGNAARIFELTGLDAVLDFSPDREAAINATIA